MLSVVVPAYRAGAGIYAAIAQLRAALDELERPYEVIVVSDGNTDDTEVEALRHGAPVKVIAYPTNRGKGHALRVGVEHATGDYIAFIDADMELDPRCIAPLVGLLDAGVCDVAIGSKRHPASEVSYPAFRRFQSRVYQTLVRGIFGLDLTDTQTGLKAFRASALRDALPYTVSTGFAFDLELLVVLRQLGMRIAEGPIRLDYAFDSTTNASAVVEVLGETMRIYRRHGGRHHVERPRSVPAGQAHETDAETPS